MTMNAEKRKHAILKCLFQMLALLCYHIQNFPKISVKLEKSLSMYYNVLIILHTGENKTNLESLDLYRENRTRLGGKYRTTKLLQTGMYHQTLDRSLLEQ